MKQFVAVIGSQNSGKSTVIKSLTGCPSSTFRGFVQDFDTKRKIYVICSSPQEHELKPSDFRKFVKRCREDNFSQGLIMAIQPSRPTKRLAIEDIFAEISGCGVFKLNAFLLNPGQKTPTQTTLEADIVSRLKQFSLKPTVLSGRRFSYVNATIINRKTHIVK